jgi:hypothetical protein
MQCELILTCDNRFQLQRRQTPPRQTRRQQWLKKKIPNLIKTQNEWKKFQLLSRDLELILLHFLEQLTPICILYILPCGNTDVGVICSKKCFIEIEPVTDFIKTFL